MQKSQFFQELTEQLSFLSAENIKTVTDFYKQKLSSATTTEQEEEMIRDFGDPSEIVQNIKLDFLSLAKNKNKHSFDSSTLLENNDEDDDDDLIFTKPHAAPKASEVIHSLENREVKTLYGEKVIIEKKSEKIEEFVLEPIDEDNGLTQEEIEHAKEETLEKVKMFHTDSLDGLSQSPDEEKSDEVPPQSKVIIEEDDSQSFDKSKETPQKKNGIFSSLFSFLHLPKKSHLFFAVLFSVILSPILLAVFGFGILAYSAVAALIVLLGIVLFALMIVLVIIGVLELVYGFLILFDNVTIALIELGLGTILFALVTAIAALIYEFLFAVTPRILKKISRFYSNCTKNLFQWLYGGIS